MQALSNNALRILKQRYFRRNERGQVSETPETLFRRVARAVASAERSYGEDPDLWEERFFNLMSQLQFLPNSPTLMNAGIPLGQLSACFVLPVEDKLDGIFSTLRHAALIQQSGGGTGFNFSHLRPANDPVKDHAGTASGPVSFMKVFDSATEHIRQGGKRRGANMGILNIDHPDILAFITAKRSQGVLRNFNISVGMSDAFMQALERNADWPLIHPNSGEAVRHIPAVDIWQELILSAWQTGDPGLIFLDAVNRENPTPYLGKIESTNPCGEVPLLPYEPCNLGSLNLPLFVSGGDSPEIHWDKLSEAVRLSVRFLDNIIDINHYIIPPIREMAMGNRKIGLGVMGWADMLILLGIPYASHEATELADRLMRFIQDRTRETSEELAQSRAPFPNWQAGHFAGGKPLRNATRTSIAPTGTISIIAGVSSSIEPLFALAFQRMHVLQDETMDSVNGHFVEYLNRHGLFSNDILQRVIAEGTCAGIHELPDQVRQLFATAPEIAPSWHLEHQLAFQRHTDNAVSKTINLPSSATPDVVNDIYRAAWKRGAKGITIFRDQSTASQVLQRGIKPGTDPCRVCVE